ncbi:MAG TPA: SusD/RagB family nutrient-binding outer membrane lipoprotein [Puia sp.]|nr:SusD/RagB family nutrient-binding outer membrane lipoprotein [Puia sp.]
MNRYIIMLLTICLSMAACKKSSFVETNINPNTLYAVDPADQFLAASSGSQDDFEYYYDVYRAMNLWLQYATNGSGNSPGFTNPTANFNYRYGKVFYGRVGSYLSDIPALVSKMAPNDQAKRVYQLNIAQIFKAYYAFYVSDINGSIPYKQAFQARYGGIITPTYDPQQALFDTLDLQIKTAVQNLEASPAATQTLYGAKDPFFGSANDEVGQWIKTGNALRLKIAMRLMKRDPTKLAAIAAEVLADAHQMADNSDSWVLYVGPSYTNPTGNWNPGGFAAAKPVVDFMMANGDPRLRIFYRPNKNGVYLGSYTSPDDVATHQALYTTTDTLSQLQHRLFTPAYDEGDGNGSGDGVGFFPFVTYAEYCFIRAELGARSITSDDAATWYTAGVTASIQFYDDRAQAAKISNYTPVTQTEIDNYLATAAVQFNPAKAIDQIASQAYLDFFRQPSEAWAWYKRTGFPNTTSVLAWSPLTASGTILKIPRRAPITVLPATDANYANQQAAFAEMGADPGWGTGPNDGFGRVWWDQQ